MIKFFKISFTLLTFSLLLNSCIARTTEELKEKLQQKHSNFDSSQISDYTNKLYISEGHFECKKGFNLANRLESTSDGKYFDYLFIDKDGKVKLFGSPTKINIDTIEKLSDFNAMIYSKNNKYYIDGIYCNHPLFGIDMGCEIAKVDIQFIEKRILIKEKSDSEHCDIYSLNK